MKRVFAAMLMGLFGAAVMAQDSPRPVEVAPLASDAARVSDDAAPPAASIETDDQRFSYILGTRFGENLKEHPASIDYPALARGIYDAMKGRELLMSESAVDEFLEKYRVELERRYIEKLDAMAKANLEAGGEFLRKNAGKEGVKVTGSGLQYRVIEQGDGPKPRATSRVKVHYVGKLLNGEVFDSSRERGQPAEFTLDGVIAGWTEGLQLMPAGSTYEFVIPPELAYGERGSPPRIEPNAALIFEVEFLEIVGEEAEGGN